MPAAQGCPNGPCRNLRRLLQRQSKIAVAAVHYKGVGPEIHRAGCAFVHLPREPSASAYGPRERLRPTRAPCSVPEERTRSGPVRIKRGEGLKKRALCESGLGKSCGRRSGEELGVEPPEQSGRSSSRRARGSRRRAPRSRRHHDHVARRRGAAFQNVCATPRARARRAAGASSARRRARTERSLEHVPGFVVAEMAVQRCDRRRADVSHRRPIRRGRSRRPTWPPSRGGTSMRRSQQAPDVETRSST